MMIAPLPTSCALALALATTLVCAGPTLAQDQALKKLGEMKVTGAPLEIPTIDQTGPKAERLAEIASKIKLPPGFKISLFAVVPDARHMAVGTNVGVVFVGTRKSKMYAVTDRDGDRVADEVKEFAPSIPKKVPNGVCFSPDGMLYSVESKRILVYPAAEFFYESPDVAVGVVTDELIPGDETSFNHGARVCALGPDKKLYVALGQPFNVPPKEKADLYWKWGVGGIVRMDTDGKNREVFAHGVRNSVGIGFNPANGDLWFTDNQVDGMGDDIPPGELNRITAPGQHFGFPWYGGGHTRTAEYKDSEPPADAKFPEVETTAHAADLGMGFYTGSMFPAQYKGGFFSAQHGSWNRTKPAGAEVLFTSLKPDGSADKTVPFAEGWLDEASGQYLGRPVAVAQYLDGSLLVSDDLTGAIWRISYAN